MKLKDLYRRDATYSLAKSAKPGELVPFEPELDVQYELEQDLDHMDPLHMRNDMSPEEANIATANTSHESNPLEPDEYNSDGHFADDGQHQEHHYSDSGDLASMLAAAFLYDDEYESFFNNVRQRRLADPNYPENQEMRGDTGNMGVPSQPYRSGNQYTPPTKPRIRRFLGFPQPRG